jgi:transcriptional regulator with XRE-family HTH domain
MLGTKIRELRKAHNMTQNDMAKKIGVKQPNLNRWEVGGRNPSLTTLKKIAQLFSVSLDILAFDKKDLKNFSIKDKSLLAKLKNLDTISEEDKETLFRLIDTFYKKSA